MIETKYWLVKNKNDYVIFFTLRSFRDESIDAFMQWQDGIDYPIYETWKQAYRAGFRCIKVTITEGWTG